MLSQGVGYICCLLFETFLQLQPVHFQDACQKKRNLPGASKILKNAYELLVTGFVSLCAWRRNICLMVAVFLQAVQTCTCIPLASEDLCSQELVLPGVVSDAKVASALTLWPLAQGGAEDGSCVLTWKGNACGCFHLIHLLCHKCGFSSFFSMALFLGAVKYSTYACQQNSSSFPFNPPDYFSGGYLKKKSERKTHLLGEDRLFKCQEKTSSICTAIKAKT